MGWSDKDVERLKAMLAEGHSASAVARVLGGGKSRNAVIGKATRLGLALGATCRLSPDEQKRRAERRRQMDLDHQRAYRDRRSGMSGKDKQDRKPPTRPASVPEPDRFARADGTQITMFNVKTLGECRWPLWSDDDAGDYPLCGHKTFGTSSYCEHHAYRHRSSSFVAAHTEAADAGRLALRQTSTGHWH